MGFKISFGGIPNSRSIILMPRLTAWAPYFLRTGSAHVDKVITKRCSKQSYGCPWQGCKATNHTVTFRNLPNPASGTYTSAHRNSPEPASGTYNSTRRNSPEPSGTYLPNLHQHTSELSGTFRRNLQKAHAGTLNLGGLAPEPTPAWNSPEPASGTSARRNSPEPSGTCNLPELASGTYTSTRRNSPEPSGTCLRNLHQHTPELAETFRNLPPEPASGTYTSTHRNSPEPATFRNLPPELTPAHTGTLRNLQPSGTCLRNLHQHTPELSGTFRNLPPEPTPATRRNSPEPSGTFLRNLLLRPAPAHTGAYLG